jgi:hypothetical protein
MQWYRVAIHTNEVSVANQSATALSGVDEGIRTRSRPFQIFGAQVRVSGYAASRSFSVGRARIFFPTASWAVRRS